MYVETPEKALRAASIRIRFADTIVKAKYGTLLEQSRNKADVMKKIHREKQLFKRRQLEGKARIKAAIEAPGLKLRQDTLLAVKKREEARSVIEDNLAAEKEFVKLCGGSHLARRRWVEEFGLFLRIDEEEVCDGLEDGEIV